ncbi:DUF4286 family protein [Porphyromonas levii]|uniref:DUF4286 family protein n=1 Tax=Porphyromonas levii TaxID=28114 RepID=UPI001BA92466|nr:DUF4286 family protein [Porphyromonas levii]MBR8703729.1 hypothetical protein [Porphyromonas levii]
MMKIMYLRTMKGYIYNITISADGSCGGDVLYFVEHRLFPTWAERQGWERPKLLRIPTPMEDGITVALQFELESTKLLADFELASDPLVTRIQEVYGEKVLFYPTLMEVIG